MKTIKLFCALLAFSLASQPGFASIILSSDFAEELSLPFLVGPNVRTFEALGIVIGAGDELTDADQTSNPGSYSGHANMDLNASGLLTLTGKQPGGFADYQSAIFSLDNLVFATSNIIVGVNIIGLGNEIFDGAFGTFFPLPVVSFTNNSVSISYNVGSLQNTDEEFNFGADLQAQFQIITGAPLALASHVVAAPASIGLFALALIFIGYKRRLQS